MQKSSYIKRVSCLIKSGLRPSKNALKYIIELKKLTRSKIDDQSIEFQSKIFKALSDPKRLKIIKLLSIRDMCVCEIMVALNMTQPTTSHHLNILENAGLIKHKRKGKWIFYSLVKLDILKKKILSFI
ncbi:MAG: metalloregulator ArsR/SmtB family transcription factor [Candidatus Bathyarchaeia archaeon]